MNTNRYFTKISDQLADDLQMGLLSFEEYGLLVYMLQRADKHTGVLIANSRSLVSPVNKDRTWVHNRLASLKRKKRIQSLTETKPELNQKRGNTNPYPIRLDDHIPLNDKTRDKPEPNQNLTTGLTTGLTRGNSEESPTTAETLAETENGKFLAVDKKDKERDNIIDTVIDKVDQELPRSITDDISQLSNSILYKWQGQLTAGPSYSKCRQALESVDGDLDKLLEAVNRAPVALKGATHTPHSALCFVLKIADNKDWYVPKYTDDQPAVKQLTYGEREAKFRTRDISYLNTLYNEYKDGVLPKSNMMGEASASTLLKLKLNEIKEFGDNLDFSLADFNAVIKLWEDRG